MRYCPNCRKDVNTVLTPGQVVIMLILLPTVILFLLYCIFHTRKCSICKTATDSLLGLDESTYKNASVASITPFNFEMYLKIRIIRHKDGKIVGYEINGTKNNLYIYKDAYLMIDNKRMIKVDLDRNGYAKYYFDYPVTGDDAQIYFFGGKLISKV